MLRLHGCSLGCSKDDVRQLSAYNNVTHPMAFLAVANLAHHVLTTDHLRWSNASDVLKQVPMHMRLTFQCNCTRKMLCLAADGSSCDMTHTRHAPACCTTTLIAEQVCPQTATTNNYDAAHRVQERTDAMNVLLFVDCCMLTYTRPQAAAKLCTQTCTPQMNHMSIMNMRTTPV
jgi:hypothetical protein